MPTSPSLGYVIFYVPDVAKTLAFWSDAFNCPQRFLHESNTYGELETGSTALAFVADSLIAEQKVDYRKNVPGESPAGAQVSFVSKDTEALFAHALSKGATLVKAQQKKPWGQVTGFVRDPNGILVEICSPAEH